MTLLRDTDAVIEAIVYLYTESRRITKVLAKRAQLTGPQLTVLKGLEQIGSLSLTELSERIRAQNSTVTGIIDRMEREGLVVRERSTEDRRVVQIKLTAKGAEIAKDISVEPMEVFREALKSLTATEVRELLRILKKVASQVRTSVENDTEEAGGAASTPRTPQDSAAAKAEETR